jgi:hypothetical protein
MFNFFSDQFLRQKSGKCAHIAETFYAMMHLFMAKRNWGVPTILARESFKSVIQTILEDLARDIFYESNTPQWCVFRCYRIMGCCEGGNSVLARSGLSAKFEEVCEKCTNEKLCAAILDEFSFDPGIEYVIPIFHKFMCSKRLEIHKAVITDLRKKRLTMKPEVFKLVFTALVITHMRELVQDPNHQRERLDLDLNFFGEVIATDPNILKSVAEDVSLLTLLREQAHFIAALLFSQECLLRHEELVEQEVDWWLRVGNVEYLKVYDISVKCAMTGEFNISEPSIYNFQGTTIVPAHLFGELVKTTVGRTLLTTRIPQLLASLGDDSIRKLRSAFFALAHFSAVNETAPIVEQLEIPEKMILVASQKASYVLKGTLIAALSLFAHTRYFSSVLQRHNWQLFRFGSHSSVIPSNPMEFLRERERTHISQNRLPPIEKYREICDALKDLSSSLIHQDTRAALLKIRDKDERPFRDPELACYAHRLLGSFYYKSQVRHEVYSCFKGVALIRAPEENQQDSMQSAFVSAKIREVIVHERKLTLDESVAWTSVEIPTLTRAQLIALQKKPRCPEVYLSDDEFMGFAKMRKLEFYELAQDRQNSIRAALFVP